MVPIVVAQQKGFYSRRGLIVDAILPPDAQTTARMLAKSQADIGFEATTDVVFAANASLPLVAIGAFSQSNSWCLIGRPGESIDVRKLKGKKIGNFTDSWTGAMMNFVLRKAALQNQDVQKIITQVDDIPLLMTGRIDLATNAAPYALAEVEERIHQQPTLACGAAIGVPDIPVWVFTASPSWLRTHGNTARAWLAATQEAVRWSADHPKEAAELFTETYPSAGSLTFNIIGWTNMAKLMHGPNGYFTETDQQWRTLSIALKDTLQVSKIKQPSDYYTNAYLPK